MFSLQEINNPAKLWDTRSKYAFYQKLKLNYLKLNNKLPDWRQGQDRCALNSLCVKFSIHEINNPVKLWDTQNQLHVLRNESWTIQNWTTSSLTDDRGNIDVLEILFA